MAYNFPFLMITGLISAALSLKTKRYKSICCLYSALMLFLIMSSNLPILGDLVNYKKSYESIAINNVRSYSSVLFVKIQQLFSSLGLNFMEYKAALIFFLFLTVFIEAKRVGAELGIILLAGFFYFQFHYSGVLRNGTAVAILYFAMHYLLEDKRGNVLKFIAFTLLAAQIHSSMYLYLVLIFAAVDYRRIKSLKKHKIFASFIFLAAFCLIRYTNVVKWMFSFVGSIVSDMKFENYAVLRTHNAWLAVLLCVLAEFAVVVWTYNKIKKDGGLFTVKCKYLQSGKIISGYEKYDIALVGTRILYINVIMVLSSLLTLFTLHFYRLSVFFSFYNLVYFGMAYSYFTKKKDKRILVALVCLLSILWFCFEYFVYGSLSYVFEDTVINGRYFWQ